MKYFDEIIAVLNQFNDIKFIKEVLTTKSQKPPSVICYTDEQLTLLTNAIDNGCILGIDRTFNLSSCFLTVICFKCHNVDSRDTNDHPILMGSLFLSWDGNEDTYHRFLSHLQTKLKNTDHTKIVFGSDQEKSLVNAVKSCFPQATHILCVKHLNDNARENLRKTQPTPVVNEILQKIFHDGRLLHSNSVQRN